MRKNKSLVLAGAVLAALPMAATAAVTLNLSVDTSSLFYGVPNTASSGWTQLTLVPNAAGAFYSPAVGTTPAKAFIPAGDGIVVGYDATMTGTGSAGASIGVGGLSFGINNSTPAFALPFGGSTTAIASTAILNGANVVQFNPTITGDSGGYTTSTAVKADAKGGGIGTTLGFTIGAGSYSANGVVLNTTEAIPGSPVISNIEFDLQAGATGTDLLTPNSTNTTAAKFGTTYYYVTAGATGGSPFTFGTDTLNINSSSAQLTLAVAGAGTTTTSSTTSASHQPIVALTTSTPSTYGTQIGNPIVISGKNGSYTVGFTGTTLNQSGGTGYTTGYTAVSVFNPLTDTEVYALKLNASGAALSPTSPEVALIAADINSAGNFANVSAGAVAGSPYASLFPGYDILLVSTTGFTAGAGGVADLGIDFSQDTDAATPGLVVTEVAAVPEPATLAGVVLGASGLLLGRRKKQIATA